MLRGMYFGQLTDYATEDDYNSTTDSYPDQVFSAQVTLDLGVTYKLNKNLLFTVGGNNILNKYPDIYQAERRSFYLYSNYQQGSNGSYYFGRVSFNF